jgi:phospholipid-binding lipoprotein MlaA
MHFRWLHPAILAAAIVGAAALSGCATSDKPTAKVAAQDDNDPFEPVNRKIWDFDLTLDRFLLKPIATGYRDYTPGFTQTGVSNALRNLRSPAIMVNDLLQGNPDRFGDTFARLALNTIFGLGGLIDVGAKVKIPYHDADFGQTLGVWGVPTGPYLVLPLLGPSDPRDGIGYGVDSFADVFSIEMRAHGIENAEYIRWGADIISSRAATIDQLDTVKKESLDFYAAIRSLYLQQRAAAVATAKQDGAPPTPDLTNEIAPETPSPSRPPSSAASQPK